MHKKITVYSRAKSDKYDRVETYLEAGGMSLRADINNDSSLSILNIKAENLDLGIITTYANGYWKKIVEEHVA